MSYYTPLDSDPTGKSDKSSKSTSAIPGTSHGKSPESAHGKSPESVHGKSPEKGYIKSLDKLHTKLPYKFLEKLHRPSDSASLRGEIEHFHSTQIDGTNSEDFTKINILSKITGLDLDSNTDELSPSQSVKDGRQRKSFRSSDITPKIACPGKRERAGLKERAETVHDRLYNACFTGDLHTVKAILREHYDTLMPDEQGQTPLYAACIGNQPEVIEYLVDRGYVVDHQDNDGKTPLHVAFEWEEPGIANLLLGKKASYKLRDVRNWTPLHSAVDHGFYTVCSRLSRRFLEEDSNTDVSWIQLLAACYENKLETVKFLLATNATVNHVSSSGHTALHIACVKNASDIVKLLLQNGAQETMNLPATSRNLAAIHHACAKNCVAVVQQLIEHGADPNILCAKNKTPCHVAVATGSTEVLQCLLTYPDVDINAVDSDGHTCLQIAVHRRNLEMVTLLLSHGADVNTLSYSCVSPLHAAVYRNDVTIVQTLLEHKADPNLLDMDGDNCLQLALHKHREEVVPMLLNAGANVSAADKDGDSCLLLAIYKQCKTQTLQLLIEKSAPLEQRNNKGYTALLLASRRSNQDVVQLLLKSGCDPNVADEDGDSVLHNALHRDYTTETVQTLIDHGASLNVINAKGHTPLLIACADDSVNVFKLLLQNGADPNISDWEGDAPLHVVCSKNDSIKVALLLKHGANPESKNDAGNEPLGYAVRKSNPVSLLEAFFTHSPTLLDMTMSSRETALHYYCRKGRTDMVEWMLSHGVDKDKVCGQGSPLDVALSHGHKNIVFMLLDAGANVSMSSYGQSFVLGIYQQRYRYMDILEHIVDKNCNVDFTVQDTAHETLFFKACRDEAVDIVEMLLDSKHDIGINICNKNGQTPVAIICANAAKPECEALTLLSMVVNSGRSVDVDTADHKKTTPLHLVCQENKALMVNLILRKSRGSVNARDSMGRTPLQLAKTTDVVNLLITFGANKD